MASGAEAVAGVGARFVASACMVSSIYRYVYYGVVLDSRTCFAQFRQQFSCQNYTLSARSARAVLMPRENAAGRARLAYYMRRLKDTDGCKDVHLATYSVRLVSTSVYTALSAALCSMAARGVVHIITPS